MMNTPQTAATYHLTTEQLEAAKRDFPTACYIWAAVTDEITGYDDLINIIHPAEQENSRYVELQITRKMEQTEGWEILPRIRKIAEDHPEAGLEIQIGHDWFDCTFRESRLHVRAAIGTGDWFVQAGCSVRFRTKD